MSTQEIATWVKLPFPKTLLKDAKVFRDCNLDKIQGIRSSAITAYLREHQCVMSRVVQEIFNGKIYSFSGFKAKQSAINSGITLKHVTVSGLGFTKSATRQEIADRSAKYGLVPLDNPRTWSIPIRAWYKNQPRGEIVSIFGVINYGDSIKKTPLELMFTLGRDDKNGKFLSARTASQASLFQPEEILIMESK